MIFVMKTMSQSIITAKLELKTWLSDFNLNDIALRDQLKRKLGALPRSLQNKETCTKSAAAVRNLSECS